MGVSVIRYCECFASGIYCDGCNCMNCHNNVENEAARREAVEATLERNPNAFRPKIAGSPHGIRDSRVILPCDPIYLLPCHFMALMSLKYHHMQLNEFNPGSCYIIKHSTCQELILLSMSSIHNLTCTIHVI